MPGMSLLSPAPIPQVRNDDPNIRRDSSAVHRALETAEIIREILTYFGPHIPPEDKVYDESFVIDRTTLFNASLTCRRFAKPALDILWSAMTDLRPLFKIITGFGEKEKTTYSLDQALCNSNLDLFNIYADRIRLYEPLEVDTIPLSTYTHTMRILNKTYLLPNLRELSIVSPRPELAFLLSENLESIRMDFWRNADQFSSFVTSLSTSAPSLRYLSLASLSISASHWSSITEFSTLRHLLIPHSSIHANTINHIPFASSLVELCVKSLTTDMHGTIPVKCLPSLKFLKITNTSLMDVIMLLGAEAAPQLEDLRLSIVNFHGGSQMYSTEDRDHWLKFFKTLATNNLQTLRRLHVSSCKVNNARGDVVGIDFSTFSGLHSLRLTQICLQLPMIETLTSGDIQIIAGSWPNLEHLEILTRCEAPLNFRDVVTIAQSMPQLKTLGIEINEGLPPFTDIPVMSHTLRFLMLANWELASEWMLFDLSRYLDRIFPNLDLIPNSCLSSIEDLFEDARAYLSALKTAREDQKSRLGL